MTTISAPAGTPRPTHSGALPRLYHLSVEQYHRMGRAGVFLDDDRVELLRGAVYEMSPIGSPHSTSVGLTWRALEGVVPAGFHTRVQDPLTLADSEPQPDVAVVRGAVRDYRDRHPEAHETALVVEVSDTSLSTDRGLKLQVYAAAGIAVYWVVNLVDETVEVYTDPASAEGDRPAEYRSRATYSAGDSVPVVINGQVVNPVAAADVLP